jgi:Tfp pilus assembly protein PilN
LSTQPEYGSHIAEQLKRLREAQPNFSTADAELFDIDNIEEQTRQALQRNRRLNEELKRIKQEQIKIKAEAAGLKENICY